MHAMILQEMGEYEESRSSLQRAIYLQPDFPLAHFALGNLARSGLRDEDARRHFANALRLLQACPPDRLAARVGWHDRRSARADHCGPARATRSYTLRPRKPPRMANADADNERILRERARALARPPSSAPAPSTMLELLEFRLASERYALEIRHVQDVHPLRDLTPSALHAAVRSRHRQRAR